MRTEQQLFPRTGQGTAMEQPSSTAALCLNVIKGPVGANVWNPLTPHHSHTTAEPEREAVTGGSTAFLGSSAKRGSKGQEGQDSRRGILHAGLARHFLLFCTVPRSSLKPCYCPDPS